MPAAFYFDLASPHGLHGGGAHPRRAPAAAAWPPVLARAAGGEVPGAAAAGPRGLAGDRAPRPRELGLQQLRWPQPFPFDSTPGDAVACYARPIGRVVPFTQAAFRQAFAGGQSLDDRLGPDRRGGLRDAPGGGARGAAAVGRRRPWAAATAARGGEAGLSGPCRL